MTKSTYKISECTKELELIKTLSNESIKALCNEVDADKMAYLLQELNKPLLLSQRAEKQKKGSENTYKVNRLVVNTAKIDILQALDLTTPKKIKPIGFKNSQINEGVQSVKEVIEVVDNFKHVMSESGTAPKAELPFRFSEMSELCDVIQKRLNDSAQFTQNDELRIKNISTLRRIFGLFTVDGLAEYLKRYIDGDIVQAIAKFRKE